MAWTAPRTWTTGELVTASIMNTHVRDNLLETGPALVTTKGDLLAAAAANDLNRLAVGANNTILTADSALTEGVGWKTSIVLSGAGVRATLTNTTDAAANQVAIFESDRATPAANDEAYVTLRLSDSAGNQDEFARLTVVGTTVTSASEVGAVDLDLMDAGTLQAFFRFQRGNIRFDRGFAPTAGDYSFGRNADATNQGQWNVPTGAGFELSVNDAAAMTLTATLLTVINTGAAIASLVETQGAGNDATLRLKIPASGLGGAKILFEQGAANGTANNMRYQLSYEGTDNYLRLQTSDADGLGAVLDVWRVPDGQLSIDANTTWDANVFDEYDDAKLLEPYREGVLNLRARRDDLIRIGVLRQYPDGFIGYNDQRMAALLAGGIYQTRQRQDAQYAELDRRLQTLEAQRGS